jgi:glycerol-3-phosphate cytidylyltransferase-like family protein
MQLRIGNTIYDLKYCEKIELIKHFLYLRFFNGKEEVIDLREYDCDPIKLFNAITVKKNWDDCEEIKKRDDKKDLNRVEELGRELGLM